MKKREIFKSFGFTLIRAHEQLQQKATALQLQVKIAIFSFFVLNKFCLGWSLGGSTGGEGKEFKGEGN